MQNYSRKIILVNSKRSNHLDPFHCFTFFTDAMTNRNVIESFLVSNLYFLRFAVFHSIKSHLITWYWYIFNIQWNGWIVHVYSRPIHFDAFKISKIRLISTSINNLFWSGTWNIIQWRNFLFFSDIERGLFGHWTIYNSNENGNELEWTKGKQLLPSRELLLSYWKLSSLSSEFWQNGILRHCIKYNSN